MSALVEEALKEGARILEIHATPVLHRREDLFEHEMIACIRKLRDALEDAERRAEEEISEDADHWEKRAVAAEGKLVILRAHLPALRDLLLDGLNLQSSTMKSDSLTVACNDCGCLAEVVRVLEGE